MDPVVLEADARATDAERHLRTLHSGLPANAATHIIPTSHLDLVECPPVAALTTVMSSGYPQTSVVWCDFDGRHVRVNTMVGFAKERNMRRDPRVTLLCYDPRQPFRYLEIRGNRRGDDRARRRAAPGRSHLEVRRPSCPLLRRRHPDLLCRERDSGPVHDSSRPCRRPRHPWWRRVIVTLAFGASVTPETVPIPATHIDLLTRPICGVLTTMGPHGQPRSSLARGRP